MRSRSGSESVGLRPPVPARHDIRFSRHRHRAWATLPGRSSTRNTSTRRFPETEDWVQEGLRPRSSYEAGHPVQTIMTGLRRGAADRPERVECGLPAPIDSPRRVRASARRAREDCCRNGRDGPRRGRDACVSPESRPAAVGRYDRGVHLARAPSDRPVPRRPEGRRGDDTSHRGMDATVRRPRVGLVIFDLSVSTSPDVYRRRSTHLQSKTPGSPPSQPGGRPPDRDSPRRPPIGTDWEALRGRFRRRTRNSRSATCRATTNRLTFYYPGGPREVPHRRKTGQDRRGPIPVVGPDAKAIVFVDYLDQAGVIRGARGTFLRRDATSRTAAATEEFRTNARFYHLAGRRRGDHLPTADLAIVASGWAARRRQGIQRAGRTMRPAGGALALRPG